MNVERRTFLVTGGASGLGAATARRLVEAGGRVVIADIDTVGGTALAEDLGTAAVFQSTDVTDEASMSAALAIPGERWGALHGVVHCAGIVAASRTLGKNGPHPLELFSRVVQVNLVGTFNVVRLAAAAIAQAPANDEGQRGVIVMTASIAAFDGQIGQAAYAASKGGVAAMTLPLARDLARHGIRVVTIAPGIFDTPMMAGMPAEVREPLVAQMQLPSRLGKPEEFAELALHIVTNPMLNGEVIRLDGAARMPPR
ncbi:MAG TPA: SDR family NAD(P)-dependent oxidoreductase [Pirellulales bacterium]|jgi:NAD(P)-dependent dehydrogenase (short-subunit alcohol dehydrogenase family)|nr:SDR family NAD(P)-dependent oxidoreductase [Pirellulales bacterium]